MHGRTKRSTQRAGSNNTTAVKPPEIHQKKYLFFFSCRGCALPCSTKGFSLSVLPCLQRDQGHRGTSTGTSTAAELGSSSLCCSAPARDRALLSTVLLQRGLGADCDTWALAPRLYTKFRLLMGFEALL